MTSKRWVASAIAVVLVSVLVASAGAAPGQVSTRELRSSLLQRLTTQYAGRFTAGLGAQAVAPCGKPTGVLCTDVVVPLDRTGVVPDTVTLHVEVLPAAGTPRGTIFLIAGGPGQGSARSYALGDPGAVNLYHFLFPGYTLVAYDDRGTGDSGLLNCPELQKANTADAERVLLGRRLQVRHPRLRVGRRVRGEQAGGETARRDDRGTQDEDRRARGAVGGPGCRPQPGPRRGASGRDEGRP